MRTNKPSTPGRDPKKRGLHPANPLWPLAELHDLAKPRSNADPEFTRFNLTTISCDEYRDTASEERQSSRAEFPIPHLVTGLPWRFPKDTTTPVVPDPAFVPFELRYIARR